ncbi:DUF4338 domain-containing protein [Pseudoxanthomonas sp. PXM03]|uniref:Druantia anti-phage system protein DruA n=1 Tax=Pseudoxanthomonas sp. PXM03 TaxID=2769284 RepID=UPI00177D9644|nr:Druantia anti-phage system protein DruA [Pseudoxanthomonas sp. PXM03]MBD9435728.1 DUF4338 domain-containing protein [Pseudoxanthomonas sp. PXM03]
MEGVATRAYVLDHAFQPARSPSLGSDEVRVPDALALSEDIAAAWRNCRQAVASGDKAAIRELHLSAKAADKSVNYEILRLDLRRLRSYFPQAAKIEPHRIEPILVPVRPRSREEHLFKIMRGYWSMPYSKGYGRRLRFLVMDAFHEAVIGIIGLQSPSADLACRDEYFRVSKEKKLAVVNNTLDAYTVGASPTYAPLLAGKLVAGFLHSNVIRQEYWRSYGGRRTTQLNQRIPQPLLAITTASAFGRSSIYNRLRQGNKVLAKPLGYTKGFGTLHLEELYPRIADWLKAHERHVPAGFGNGPKVRWQNIMRALIDLGLSREHLEHGLRREVFIFELVHNLTAVCQSDATPEVTSFDDREWGNYWKERWCIPRAARDADWQEFDAKSALLQALLQ